MLKSTQLAIDACRSVTGPAGVAVIGVDHPSRRVLRALRENLDADVLWMCDADRDRLQRQLRRCPGARITTRIDRVLGDPAVDAVFIAGPTHTHYRLITQALEAGKHVFVQTPLAPCSELADEIADTASAQGRILTCGSTFLHSPPVHAIKQVVSREEMGDLYFVSSSRVTTDTTRPDVDVIIDLGPRELFVLLYWLSELPTTVRAAGRAVVRPGKVDVAFITLTFASGVLASLELSRVGPRGLSRTVLVGSQRMAVYDEGADDPVRLLNRGGARIATANAEERDSGQRPGGESPAHLRLRELVAPPIENRDPLGIEVDAFIAAVRHGERMEYQAALARSVLRVVEAAELSLSRGAQEVPLGRPACAAELAGALRPPAGRLHAVR